MVPLLLFGHTFACFISGSAYSSFLDEVAGDPLASRGSGQLPHPVETEPPFRGTHLLRMAYLLRTALAAARRGPTASSSCSMARSARDQGHC